VGIFGNLARGLHRGQIEIVASDTMAADGGSL
jgi:hypothetical protein